MATSRSSLERTVPSVTLTFSRVNTYGACCNKPDKVFGLLISMGAFHRKLYLKLENENFTSISIYWERTKYPIWFYQHDITDFHSATSDLSLLEARPGNINEYEESPNYHNCSSLV